MSMQADEHRAALRGEVKAAEAEVRALSDEVEALQTALSAANDAFNKKNRAFAALADAYRHLYGEDVRTPLIKTHEEAVREAREKLTEMYGNKARVVVVGE